MKLELLGESEIFFSFKSIELKSSTPMIMKIIKVSHFRKGWTEREPVIRKHYVHSKWNLKYKWSGQVFWNSSLRRTRLEQVGYFRRVHPLSDNMRLYPKLWVIRRGRNLCCGIKVAHNNEEAKGEKHIFRSFKCEQCPFKFCSGSLLYRLWINECSLTSGCALNRGGGPIRYLLSRNYDS